MTEPWEADRHSSATNQIGPVAGGLRPRTGRLEPAGPGGSEEGRDLVRFAGDIGSEPAQRLGKARITAVDVLGTADRRRAVGDQAGDDQRRPRADVAGLDGCPGEPLDPVQHDVMTIDPRLGTQTGKLLYRPETRLEDVLG